MKTLYPVFLIIFSLLLVQCKPSKKSVSTNEDQHVADSMQEGEKKSDTDFLLLSPNEILDDILTEKIVVNQSWVNPISNAEKYIDTRSQAINLGVYVADFAYLNINSNKTNALEYFKTIRLLAQKLNITGYFTESFFSRIENNLTRNDSIINISKEMYYSMSDILEESNRQNIYALVACGTMVEVLYLTSIQVTNFNEYKRIAQKIFDQKLLFDNFYGYASIYRSDENVNIVMKRLDALKVIFDKQMEGEVEKNHIVKDKKNHLIIGGSKTQSIKEEEFVIFKRDIISIRRDFVNTFNK